MWTPSVNLLWLLLCFKSASFFWIISYGFWGPRTPRCKTFSRSASHPLDLLSSNLLHQTYEDCFLFAGLCESPAVKVFYMVATFSAPKVFSLSKTQVFCVLWRCSKWRTHVNVPTSHNHVSIVSYCCQFRFPDEVTEQERLSRQHWVPWGNWNPGVLTLALFFTAWFLQLS